MRSEPKVHVVTGGTGAGKTTYALKLAAETGGIRFSIDEWMTTLFWMDSADPISYDWAMERIGRAESQIWNMAQQVLAQGSSVILDLGFTKAAHRQKFYDLAREAGAELQLHWIDIPAAERWRRVENRNAEKGETFAMDVTRDMFNFMEGQWENPSKAELLAQNGLRHSRE
jgi:predicted kinase